MSHSIYWLCLLKLLFVAFNYITEKIAIIWSKGMRVTSIHQEPFNRHKWLKPLPYSSCRLYFQFHIARFWPSNNSSINPMSQSQNSISYVNKMGLSPMNTFLAQGTKIELIENPNGIAYSLSALHWFNKRNSTSHIEWWKCWQLPFECYFTL